MAHKPSSRIPSYRLHKPTGQAVVTLDGHDNYLGKFDSPQSRQKYDRLIAEWLSLRSAALPQPAAAAISPDGAAGPT
jgi:hypothetical protein